jgi:hypothetical protein
LRKSSSHHCWHEMLLHHIHHHRSRHWIK